MRICLIGKNLTNYVLAKNLASKNLNVDIIYENKNENFFFHRTIAISKNNFDFLLKINKKTKIPFWPIKNIKIFCDQTNSKELFEFKNENQENFFLVKYNDIFNSYEKVCQKSKNIKFKLIKNNSKIKNLYEKNNYNIVINSDSKNKLNKKYFNKRIEKNYNSFAYTAIMHHEKIKNNIAIQIFTKFGPLAFLPISNNKTSLVFSVSKDFKLDEIKIIELIKKYNVNYKINKINNFEKFNLKFFMQRNYIYNNILSFGDLSHRIHPLAGQGFNMTIRDIIILSSLIDDKIDLGLDLDKSLLNDFQNKTKHLNYIFGMGVHFIHEFFHLDNKTNNFLSKSISDVLGKNNLLNKYANLIADKGIHI